MRTLKKPLILLFILANIYAILCGGLYFFQENLLFHPQVIPDGYTFKFDHTFEEVWLDADDGARLHGIHFPVAQAKGVILYFHGNAGEIQRWGEITSFFVEKEYSVIVMDYRGYGRSRGALSQEALYTDSELWFAFAKAKYPETPLTLYGRSLGTTFAAFLASEKQAQNVILETPFYSIADEAKSRFPILPIETLLKYPFPTYRFVNNIDEPITFFHGTEDGVVAYEHGRKLFDLLESQRKEFVTIPNGGHNNLVQFAEYLDEIDAALTK